MEERSLVDVDGPVGPDARNAAAEYYAVMAALSDALLDAHSEEELWRRAAHALVDGGAFATACVARPDGDGNLRLVEGAGAAHDTLSKLRLPLDGSPGSPPALAWSASEPRLERDARGAAWLAGAGAHQLGSLLAVPVRKGGEAAAVLCVAASEPGAFDDAARQLCRRVGRLLERWLDHHKQLPHLQHQALHDPLTDLPNRRMLEEHLGTVLARARRRGTAVAVGVLDLDDFKPINDTCGHGAGDRLLRELGARLRGELRGQDLLVRLGGDEFALVIDELPVGSASAELTKVLERLHSAVEAPFELDQGRSGQVDMSLGVAVYPFDADDIDQLLREADKAMYRSKSNKLTRLQWWQLASASQDTPQLEATVPPYGPEAAGLLAQARGLLAEASTRFTSDLVEHLGTDADSRARFGRVGPPPGEAHAARLGEHFTSLLAPEAERDERRARAEEVGGVHALAGVGPESVVEAVGFFRTLLNEVLAASSLTARERYRLVQVAEARLQDELQYELQGHSAVVTEHYGISAAPLPAPGTPWVDAVQAELEALAALPGIRAASLQRPDAEGRLTVEAHAGEAGARLAALTREPDLIPLTDGSRPERVGLVGRAWSTGDIQRSGDYQHDERTGLWRDPLAGLGVRSVMAVPVPGPHDRPVAILVLYGAWLGQFDAAWTPAFAQGLQQRWEALWRRRRDPLRAPALARPLAEHYRERLFDGGLTMHLQPVVDLQSGRVVAGEALARLRLEDGSILTPGAFLPLLGELELARLFRLTLDQALAALVAWDAATAEADPAPAGVPDAAAAVTGAAVTGAAVTGAAVTGAAQLGPPPEIAVNLPPSALLEPDCVRWIGDALSRHGVAPQRLSLELIETEEIGQEARRATIRALVELGVRLSIDDLGSGYSSLQRLAELPFDTMKIDQALVGRMADQPLQTLSLVRSLVRLGEDLGRRVVVEGTSDVGLVEAASVLGARYAQGFGLARPMAADGIADWQAAFRMPATPGRLHTTLGALAWHWRARRGRMLAHPASLTACPLHGYFHATEQQAGEGARLHAQMHAQMHAGSDPTASSDRLLAWLAERAQRQAEPV